MFRDPWDFYYAAEEAAWAAETLRGAKVARDLVPQLRAQQGFGPAPLLPTNLSVRTAR